MENENSTETAVQAPNGPATESTATPDAAAGNGAEQAQNTDAIEPGANTRAFLETLGANDDNGTNAGDKENTVDGEAAKQDGQQTTAKIPTQTPEGAAAAAGTEGQPLDEEAELLEGVKSDRGRERIKTMLAQKKELESDVNEFKGMIRSTGMSEAEFAQTLEYGRLVSSGDEKNLRTALQMLDAQRAAIAGQLGIEVPGFDPLAEHADLVASVEGMEITRDHAIELAKHRKQSQQQQASQAREQQMQVSQQQYAQELQSVGQTMQSFLESRMNEADHKVRWASVESYFKDPENVQKFVQTYEPRQWLSVFEMIYNGVQVPKAPAPKIPQPLRSRPANMGSAEVHGATELDRLNSRLASLGI
jgi:hypothetical protein